MVQSPHSSATKNRLLSALPPASLAGLLPKLRPVSLPLRKTCLFRRDLSRLLISSKAAWCPWWRIWITALRPRSD